MAPSRKGPVEKGDSPECLRTHCAIQRGRVESAKKQRGQHSTMVVAPGQHAVREPVSQKSVIAVQPSSRFEEREEQQP